MMLMMPSVRGRSMKPLIVGLLSLIFAVYLAYQASLRAPSFSIALAQGLLEEPVKTRDVSDKYQAAYNLHKGVSVKRSEKRMHRQFNPQEIKKIADDAAHRQLTGTAILAVKALVAWVIGSLLIAAFAWFIGVIFKPKRRS